jgi:peptide/nickel transport system ATP-binding protein/oligopeptide transport system ATP-binding protein
MNAPCPLPTDQTADVSPMTSVRDLVVEFATAKGVLRAVNGVSFDVRAGETFGLIGESGCGKSTLGRALVSLIKPTSGEILHEGVNAAALSPAQLRSARRAWQIIFQDPNAALNPRMSILQSLMEPLEVAGGKTRREIEALALEALDRVGLPATIAARYPHQLSGGQKQRIVIARALTLRPKLIVCDEVVAALDMSIRGEILNLFAQLQRDLGLTYVFITHDLSVVRHVSDRIAVAYLGRFVELTSAQRLIERPMHPYTRALFASEPIPAPSDARQRKPALEGEIPNPMHPPSGCAFRTRCPLASARCANELPLWREVEAGHFIACHFAEQI